ncbi:hypothetical protein BS78_K273000 [Paspalum vaginatum]|uniref:Uncharacterized protein n=1 Tax=Paspalum vaginatum TaxID=158149 RepID=A0A9W7XBE8_9POAL|nr:hypothetical protein BS78_K273000 [Paspalum vaginatum]
MCVFLLPSSSSSRREGSSGGARSIPVLRGSGARRGVPGREEEKTGKLYPLPQTAGGDRGEGRRRVPLAGEVRRCNTPKWEGLGRRGLDGKVESRAAKLGAVTVELGSGAEMAGGELAVFRQWRARENEGEENQRARGGRRAREIGSCLALARWRVARALSARGSGAWPRRQGRPARGHGRSARSAAWARAGGERKERRVGGPGLWTTVADRWGQSPNL